MRIQGTSEHQDVYEFHDDSGEENPCATNGDRSKVAVVTIKSPVPSKDPVEQDEKDESSKEDTANTRKSKRLQGKDRTTIDDTIEDVIRNCQPPNQTRRTTRAAAANLAIKSEELKKSPRSSKKVKDAKTIDATFDSGDEQPVLSKTTVAKVAEQPVEETSAITKVEENEIAEPVSILDPKTGVLSFMGHKEAHMSPKKEEPSPSIPMNTPSVSVAEVKPTSTAVKSTHILPHKKMAKQLQQQQQQLQQQQQHQQQPQPQQHPPMQHAHQKPNAPSQDHPMVIQATQQSQTPAIRHHTMKAHILNSQKQLQQTTTPPQSSSVVKPPPIQPEQHSMHVPKIQQPSTSVHQKVGQQHPSHNMPMNVQNLVVQIPLPHSPHSSIPSPRMQGQGSSSQLQQQTQSQVQQPMKLQHPPQIMTAMHVQQSAQIQQQIQQQHLAKQQQMMMQQIQVSLYKLISCI